MVTRRLIEPSTTWLLVRMSPVESRIRPVPAAGSVALAVWTVLLMSTTEGVTLAATEAGLDEALFGAGETVWMDALPVLCELMARARFQPIPMPPPVARTTAAMMATARPRVAPWWGSGADMGTVLGTAGGARPGSSSGFG